MKCMTWALGLLLLGATARAETAGTFDWPQWQGAERNSVSREEGLLQCGDDLRSETADERKGPRRLGALQLHPAPRGKTQEVVARQGIQEVHDRVV